MVCGLAVLMAGSALAAESIAPLNRVTGKAVQLSLNASPGC